MHISVPLSRGARSSAAVLCLFLISGCASKTETPVVSKENSPNTANLPVPSRAAIDTQKRATLERRLNDVQNNPSLPADMKTKAVNDLKQQIAELPAQ